MIPAAHAHEAIATSEAELEAAMCPCQLKCYDLVAACDNRCAASAKEAHGVVRWGVDGVFRQLIEAKDARYTIDE